MKLKLTVWIIAFCSITICLSSCGGGSSAASTPRPALDPTYRASGHSAAGDVFVHLFEWSWNDIANECASLGQKGFKAVQVSPPQEDILGAQWWTRYQPVSYSIGLSRSGTQAQFVAMVASCKVAGVDIYVDAVINHMTAGSGTGSNGTSYSKYNYPGLYSQSDFHSPCSINNYQDAANVQDCELVGLADINTGSTSVQQKIADYLVGLVRLGVAGFRIDAAKHIQQVELDGIITKVNQAVATELAAQGKPLPYFFAEVIDNGGEAVKARDYFGLGYLSGGATDITEFKFRGVGDKFLGSSGQKLSQLNPNGTAGNQFSETAWGLMPAEKAVVFLENHDTQRSGGISYRTPAAYRLANIWMLAQPYGYPSIMSSYAFDLNNQAGKDAGPPPMAAGCATRLETANIGQWVCEHRDPMIANMIAFRRAVAGQLQQNWWDNGNNAIAFSRGKIGFVVINHEATALSINISTGLPAGTYCDVLSGGKNLNMGCANNKPITVDNSGNALINLDADSGLVLLIGI